MKPKKPVICETVKEKVKIYLCRTDYPQSYVAHKIGLSESTFSRILNYDDFCNYPREFMKLNELTKKEGIEL